MQTLTYSTRSRYTLTPTRDVGAFRAKLDKCNGKAKRSPIKSDSRSYPKFKAGDSTADYVRAYEALNGCLSLHAIEWQALNDAPCTLYSGEDAHQTLPDEFATWAEFDAAQCAAPDLLESAPPAANDPGVPVDQNPAPAAPGGQSAAEIVPTDNDMREDAESMAVEAEDKARRRRGPDAPPPGYAIPGPLATHSDPAPSADPLPVDSPADDGGFSRRVTMAAAYIGAGRRSSRAFDSCFEMWDGDAVAVALLRRAEKRPDTKLAANIWRYLGRATVEAAAARQPAGLTLAEWSRALIDAAEARCAALDHDSGPLPADTVPLPAESAAEYARAFDAEAAAMPAADFARWNPNLTPAKAAEIQARAATRHAKRQPCRYALIDGSGEIVNWSTGIGGRNKLRRQAADYCEHPGAPFTVRKATHEECDAWSDAKHHARRENSWPTAQPVPGDSAPVARLGHSMRIVQTLIDAMRRATPGIAPTAGALRSEAARVQRTGEEMRNGSPQYAADCRMAASGLRDLAEHAEATRAATGAAIIAQDLTLDEAAALCAHVDGGGAIDAWVKPGAPIDDDTEPAPLDGLDVAELGADGLAEFERAGGTLPEPTAPAYSDAQRPQGPSLRIPATDPRARIPARFAPVYCLRA